LKNQLKNRILRALLLISCITVFNIVLFSFQEKSNSEKIENTIDPKNCVGCHNKIIKVNGREIKNIAEKYKMKHVHDPYDLGCLGCHKIHSNENESMLVSKYPVTDYVKGELETFKFCFSCHNTALLTNENTDKLTKFRNGNKNLHFLHVNKSKGRNCILCHDVHGSNNPKLINDNVKFGKWLMPVKFIKTENGGSCAPGCHSLLSYDRKFVEKPQTISIFGNITISDEFDKSSLKDLKIYLCSNDNKFSDSTILAKDLSYELKNLPPGIFQIWIDSLQLKTLNLSCNPTIYSYEIKNEKDLNKPSNMIFDLQKIPEPGNDLTESDEVFIDDGSVDVIQTANDFKDNNGQKTDIPFDSTKISNIKKDQILKTNKNKKLIRIKKGETKIFVVKESNKNNIAPDMRNYLSSLSKYLRKFPKTKLLIEIEINGNINPDVTNINKTDYSANIISYFKSKGISASRLVIQNIIPENQNEKKSNSKIKKQHINLKIIN
jgi:hypothetical protein